MTRSSAKRIANQIVSGSAISIGLRVLGVALGYVAHILLSRLLGLGGYGQYAIALGWVLVLVLPARLGFDYSALRYVTAYLENGNRTALRGFIRVSVGTVTLASLLIGGAMVLVGTGLNRSIDLATLLGAAALVMPLALLGVVSVMLRVAKQFMASQFYDQVLRAGTLIILLGVWALLRKPIDPATALLLTTLAAFIALGALGVHFRKEFADIRTIAPGYGDSASWFALSLPLLGISVTQELLNQLEVILLGALADAHSAGLFAAASRLVSLMAFALAAFGIVGGPLIASAYHRRDFAELQYITTFTTRIGLFFAVGVALVLVGGGNILLGFFGPEFRQAFAPLMILTIGGLVNAFTGIVVYLTTLTGRERPALLIFLLALVISLSLNLLLIPRLGVIGAAIASSSALSFWNLAMLVYVRRVLGIDASALGLSLRSVH